MRAVITHVAERWLNIAMVTSLYSPLRPRYYHTSCHTDVTLYTLHYMLAERLQFAISDTVYDIIIVAAIHTRGEAILRSATAPALSY